MLKTPIIFLTFNRPYLTEKVFEEIRKIKPQKLFWIADGPRSDVPEDEDKCAQVRALSQKVDWDCEVFRDFSENNLGSRRRVSSGISGAFEKIEQAIILEDDCLPRLEFFHFCEQMLEKYQGNKRIMAVSGNHFLSEDFPLHASYYFLSTPLIWGWATWRRAWEHYPRTVAGAQKLLDIKSYRESFINNEERRLFQGKIKSILSGRLDTWDYLWSAAVKKNEGLCICPASNLVANIGFGIDASNTFGVPPEIFSKTEAFAFPLKEPDKIETDIQRDLYIFQNYIRVPLWQRIKDLVARFIFYRFFKVKLQALLKKVFAYGTVAK